MAIHHIPVLQAFIKQLENIPFVSSRHTFRLADYFLSMELSVMEDFFKSLIILRNSLNICEICTGWKEIETQCLWCTFRRDQSKLCIVETWIDAGALEKTGIFNGAYHILGGVIDPLNGKTPDMLSIGLLLKKLKKQDSIVMEIIIATNQTPEGNATALYIHRLLEMHKIVVTVTQLAAGVPVGSSLEYIDRLTIGKALYNRR